MPRWLNFLRSTPCFSSPFFQCLDDIQKITLSFLTNVDFVDSSWIQATLAVCWGGLGVRSVVDLEPSAYFASLYLVRNLVDSILAPPASVSFNNSQSLALQCRESQGACLFPAVHYVFCSVHGMTRFVLRDYIFYFAILQRFTRILAFSAPTSGSWLHAIPTPSWGLRLSNSEVRLSLGLQFTGFGLEPLYCRLIPASAAWQCKQTGIMVFHVEEVRVGSPEIMLQTTSLQERSVASAFPPLLSHEG